MSDETQQSSSEPTFWTRFIEAAREHIKSLHEYYES
jgi:hypothetical protein